MTLYPGISKSAPVTLSNVLKGIGFVVSIAPNPSAYRGLGLLVSISYDGTTFGDYVPVRMPNFEAFQNTAATVFFESTASKVNYVVQNFDQAALNATVTATAL